jgi:hypothetical protein
MVELLRKSRSGQAGAKSNVQTFQGQAKLYHEIDIEAVYGPGFLSGGFSPGTVLYDGGSGTDWRNA